jgi:spermidine synthase
MEHNISTTVVEIDPAVYEAARNFFGMPDPGPDNVFLEDARGWVERRRHSQGKSDPAGDTSFDIVVHDCFSGGGVPKHLFSVEFWEGLKSLMHEKGVVAVVSPFITCCFHYPTGRTRISLE